MNDVKKTDRRCPGSGAAAWSYSPIRQVAVCDFCNQSIVIKLPERTAAAHDADPRQKELVPA